MDKKTLEKNSAANPSNYNLVENLAKTKYYKYSSLKKQKLLQKKNQLKMDAVILRNFKKLYDENSSDDEIGQKFKNVGLELKYKNL